MARATGDSSEQIETPKGPNPVWFKPVMVAFMLIGLAWILVFYLTGTAYPIPGIGAWNLAVGFGIAFIGFLMTTQWR
ncbi:MAG: cell division protein CrgA [Microbacterium sp.]